MDSIGKLGVEFYINTHANIWLHACICQMFFFRKVHGRFYGLDYGRFGATKKTHKYQQNKPWICQIRKWSSIKRLLLQIRCMRKENCIHTWPVWLIAIWDWLLEFYSNKTTQFINMWNRRSKCRGFLWIPPRKHIERPEARRRKCAVVAEICKDQDYRKYIIGKVGSLI